MQGKPNPMRFLSNLSQERSSRLALALVALGLFLFSIFYLSFPTFDGFTFSYSDAFKGAGNISRKNSRVLVWASSPHLATEPFSGSNSCFALLDNGSFASDSSLMIPAEFLAACQNSSFTDITLHVPVHDRIHRQDFIQLYNFIRNLVIRLDAGLGRHL